MSVFDYKCLTNSLVPISVPSMSLWTNTATTASYVRSIIIHNVSSSVQTAQLWLVPNNVSSGSMSDAWRFLNAGISGSSTLIMEFGNPGMIVTQSNAAIWAATTNDKGINVMIVGGAEL